MSDQGTKKAFSIGDYVEAELTARGWSIQYAASRIGPEPVHECWLELVCTTEIWEQHNVKFGESEAEMLEMIFGVESQTWLNINTAFENDKLRAQEQSRE